MSITSEAKPPLLPEGVTTLLRDLIQERLGIFFEEDRMDLLIEKLGPLIHQFGCHSYLDYYYHLKYDNNSDVQWDLLMEALSVQETYFWREMAQIRALVDHVIPAWFEKNSRPLKIWSAASASGEEAYGIAMAILESSWAKHPIEIVASDFSPAALAKAKKAIYRENAFRSFPTHIREKYFQKQGNVWKLNDEVTSRAHFQRANLMAPNEISTLARAPVIFCRNVFIYFSSYSIRQTVATFATRMPKNGHLFIGASESLLRLTTDFELKELGEAFVYVRV
ncbi:MAG: CheR family methyltransferase [Verrucomicrobiales bacterium]